MYLCKIKKSEAVIFPKIGYLTKLFHHLSLVVFLSGTIGAFMYLMSPLTEHLIFIGFSGITVTAIWVLPFISKELREVVETAELSLTHKKARLSYVVYVSTSLFLLIWVWIILHFIGLLENTLFEDTGLFLYLAIPLPFWYIYIQNILIERSEKYIEIDDNRENQSTDQRDRRN